MKFSLICIFCITIINCAAPVIHVLEPIKDYTTIIDGKQSYTRTLHGDVIVEAFFGSDLIPLMAPQSRLPRDFAYRHILVSITLNNTDTRAMAISEPELIIDKQAAGPLSSPISHDGLIVDLAQLFSLPVTQKYRVLSYSLSGFREQHEELIPYDFSFILPGDTIRSYYLFPVKTGGKFNARITIPFIVEGNKKIVAVEFTRRDYRQNDTDFSQRQKTDRQKY